MIKSGGRQQYYFFSLVRKHVNNPWTLKHIFFEALVQFRRTDKPSRLQSELWLHIVDLDVDLAADEDFVVNAPHSLDALINADFFYLNPSGQSKTRFLAKTLKAWTSAFL